MMWRSGASLASPFVAALLIVAIAVATRIVAWWNPVAHVDDQFYLLAGEELLKGRLAIRRCVGPQAARPVPALCGDRLGWRRAASSVLNLVATAFAAATALVHAPDRAALCHHRTEPPWRRSPICSSFRWSADKPGNRRSSTICWSPASALLLITRLDRSRTRPSFDGPMAAMLLCGFAMTIKQISFIEGAYFGLAFLWLLQRRGMMPGATCGDRRRHDPGGADADRVDVRRLCAGGPGQLDAFVFATVTSIFLKSGWHLTAKLAGIAYFVLYMTPLLIMALCGALDRRKQSLSAPLNGTARRLGRRRVGRLCGRPALLRPLCPCR